MTALFLAEPISLVDESRSAPGSGTLYRSFRKVYETRAFRRPGPTRSDHIAVTSTPSVPRPPLLVTEVSTRSSEPALLAPTAVGRRVMYEQNAWLPPP